MNNKIAYFLFVGIAILAGAIFLLFTVLTENGTTLVCFADEKTCFEMPTKNVVRRADASGCISLRDQETTAWTETCGIKFLLYEKKGLEAKVKAGCDKVSGTFSTVAPYIYSCSSYRGEYIYPLWQGGWTKL